MTAVLSLAKSWLTYIPSVLGNEDCDSPFAVRVKRLSVGELEAWQRESWDLRGKLLAGLTVDELEALFAPALDGPVGGLTIDGQRVETLRDLLEFVAIDPPLQGCLFDGLREAVIVANHLAETQRKNCERRRGGDGGQATTAASPHPSDAPDADASSGRDSTSSESAETASPGPS